MRRHALAGLAFSFFLGSSFGGQPTTGGGVPDSGSASPHRMTSPQIVSGGNFTSQLVLLNTSSTTCRVGMSYHLGAGEFPTDPILTNGQDLGNIFELSVPPVPGVQRLTVRSTGQELFTGAATAEILNAACFGSLTVNTKYSVFDGRDLVDLFSYESPTPVPLGQCAAAPVELDPDPSDGQTNIPGLANVSLRDIDGVIRTMMLFDSDGNLINSTQPLPYNPEHAAQLLTEFFPDQDAFSGSWKVCFSGQPTGQPPQEPIVIDTLFIDVVTSGSGTQLGTNEHSVLNPDCLPGPGTLCLNGNRFQVDVQWNNPPQFNEPGFVQDLKPDDTGFFFFLDPDNTELLVKVLDGCSFNDHFWVFYAATTDVEYTLTVTDTRTSQTRQYTSPLGQPSPAVIDTDAFATCP